MNSMDTLIRLRKEAMVRCAERIKSKKKKNHVNHQPETGLTSITKSKHGL